MSLDFKIQENGAPTRTRTADLLITNQLLYQLSYRGFARRLRCVEGSCKTLLYIHMPNASLYISNTASSSAMSSLSRLRKAMTLRKIFVS